MPRSRLGADLLDDVLGRFLLGGDLPAFFGSLSICAGIDGLGRPAGTARSVVLFAGVATDDEVAEADLERSVRIRLDVVIDDLHQFDHLDDRLHRLHHRGVLRLAEQRPADVEQCVLLGTDFFEQRDFLGQRLGERFERFGDGVHLFDDRRKDTCNELAQVERDVLEDDQRCFAKRRARAAASQRRPREDLVVAQRRCDAGEIERMPAPHVDRIGRERALRSTSATALSSATIVRDSDTGAPRNAGLNTV